MAIGVSKNLKISNYVTVFTNCRPYHPAALGSSLESLYGKSGPGGDLGSRPLGAAAPVFVLEAVRGRWRVLAGEEGTGGLGETGSRTQSGLPLRRGSSVAIVDPSVGGEGGRTEALHCIPGRGGEWEREEAVERLQQLERGQRPWR